MNFLRIVDGNLIGDKFINLSMLLYSCHINVYTAVRFWKLEVKRF